MLEHKTRTPYLISTETVISQSPTAGLYKRLFKRYVHGTVFILQLRGNHILALPNPKTTTYGLHSFSYLASKIWNSLPDTYKTLNFLEFKQEILRYEAFRQ